MRHYSLLLGTAVGLALSTTAYAADLPNKAKPVHHVQISGYHAAFNATGGYHAAFYYEPANQHRHFYTARFDLPVYNSVSFGAVNDLPLTTVALSKTSEGVWPGLAGLAQKLLSSASFSGSPSHGFVNLDAVRAFDKSKWAIVTI